MKKRVLIALAIMSIMGMMCSCQTGTAQNSVVSQSGVEVSQTSESDERKIDEVMAGYDFSGFMAVVKNGECIYAKDFNQALDGQELASDTVFRIGSDTKQFTAAGIMLLQQKGRLSVKDTLDKYFPEYSYGREITIHDLLDMHSGLDDYSNHFGDLGLTDNAEKNKENILKYMLEAEPINEPKEVFTYNNGNYFLLATIIEKVSGMAFEEYLTENIFKPLGMDSTSLYKDYEKDGAVIAKPLHPTGAEDYFNMPGVTFGSGDVMSSAGDLMKWLKVFEGGSILSDESIEAMTASYSNEDDMYEYGYGWFISSEGIYHGGNLSEYAAMIFTSPKDKNSIILLSNQNAALLSNISTSVRYEIF